MPRKEQLYLALTAIGTAVLYHLLFSPYGFNPTDEGFVLSSSMRILHGQVPHVDFSSLRPLGYAYLHMPELLIGKAHTFLVSRLVFWLEMSAIAYAWVLILMESSKFEVRNSKFLVGVYLFMITFIFNAHYFPIAVLHTIDGLLFALVGFYILMRAEKYDWLGGLFIGYAVLCKQGYAVLIPLLVWFFPKNKSAWISALIPGIFYVVYISVLDGWYDLLGQLGAHTELLEVGILNYVLNPWLFGGIILNFGSHKLRIHSMIAVVGHSFPDRFAGERALSRARPDAAFRVCLIGELFRPGTAALIFPGPIPGLVRIDIRRLCQYRLIFRWTDGVADPATS